MNPTVRTKGGWRWKALALLVPALLVLLAGCGARRCEVGVVYQGSGSGRSVPEAEGASLYLAPVQGSKERFWYADGYRCWFLKRPPTELVHEALARGLEGMGLVVTEQGESAMGRLEARIRWFAPYGHTPFAPGVIVSLSLHAKEGEPALWWGRIRAGRATAPSERGPGTERQRLEAVLSEVLTEAVDRLRWKPGFRHALSRMKKPL